MLSFSYFALYHYLKPSKGWMLMGSAGVPTLETERLLLRKITMEDAYDMFAYCSDEEVAKYVTWNAHKNIEDTETFIASILENYQDHKPAPWGIVLKENNRLIGTVGFTSMNPIHHSAEIGFALSRNNWGKGIMTEAVKEIIKYGFETLHLNRIQAMCFKDNIASERVMIKSGMSYEGLHRQKIFNNGRYIDVKLYSILKEEY